MLLCAAGPGLNIGGLKPGERIELDWRPRNSHLSEPLCARSPPARLAVHQHPFLRSYSDLFIAHLHPSRSCSFFFFWSFTVLVDPPTPSSIGLLSFSDSEVIDGTPEASVSSHPPPWSPALSLSGVQAHTHTHTQHRLPLHYQHYHSFTGFILSVPHSLPVNVLASFANSPEFDPSRSPIDAKCSPLCFLAT